MRAIVTSLCFLNMKQKQMPDNFGLRMWVRYRLVRMACLLHCLWWVRDFFFSMLKLYILVRFLRCYLRTINSQIRFRACFPQRNSTCWSFSKPTSILSPSSHITSKTVREIVLPWVKTYGGGLRLFYWTSIHSSLVPSMRQTCPLICRQMLRTFLCLVWGLAWRAKGVSWAPSAGNRWRHSSVA